MTDNQTEMRCHVCGEPIAEWGHSLCNNCDRPFHLRQREDADGEDCGEVWINEQFLALEFACFVCLGKGAGPGNAEPPVARGH